ncbi:MAG TPA: hypothetical protein VK191_10865 [Symbiobacteriaceae bacterium]|nr:hypothetical protein [Symbiobacteriaceae bacterium]
MVQLFPEPVELFWTGLNILIPVGIVALLVGLSLSRHRALRALRERITQLEERVEAMERSNRPIE